MPTVVDAVQKRLPRLEHWLGGRDRLEHRFRAWDQRMTTLPRVLRHPDIVSARPARQAYQARCEAQLPFQKPIAGHLKPFAAGAA